MAALSYAHTKQQWTLVIELRSAVQLPVPDVSPGPRSAGVKSPGIRNPSAKLRMPAA